MKTKTMNQVDQELLAAAKAFKDADKEALECLKDAMPKGRVVRWDRGGHMQTGEVVEVLGFEFRHARIRIYNVNTDKTVDIHAGTVRARRACRLEAPRKEEPRRRPCR